MGTATLLIQRPQSKSRLPGSWSLFIYWDQAEPRDQVLVSDALWQVTVDAGLLPPGKRWEEGKVVAGRGH